MSREPQANILLVDDTPNNLVVLEAALESLGQNLVRAGSGSEALRRLLVEDFAVILLDVQMPGMDGFETAELIRGRDRSRDAPIIFMTAYEHTEVQIFKGYSVGAVDFLFKPIIPEVLRSKVRVFVDLYRKTEKIRRQAELLRESQRVELERQIAEERRRAEAERIQATLRIAQEIQRNFFPSGSPSLPGFDIFGASYPAEVTGGDYFDYLPLPDQALGIAIGDVCGHGFGPALLMAATRAYLRALVLTHTRVGGILELVNRALEADVSDGRFVTLCLARIDPETRSLTYASAGHPSAYVVGARGEVRAELRSTGLPLGIVPEAQFPEAPGLRLEPGDTVLFLTDGIVEATNRDQVVFGAGRAIEAVRAHRHKTAREVVSALDRSVRAFVGHTALLDDVTSLVVKVGDGGDLLQDPS